MHPTATEATPHQHPTLVLWLSVAQLVSWGCVFYGFSLLMEPVEASLNMSRAESSLAFSLALLMEGLLAYPVGRWIDRGHERAVMVGGSCLMGLALAAHSLVQTPLQFYAVWLMLGVGMSATLYPPAFAVLTRRYPQHFRRAIITLTFLGGLASTHSDSRHPSVRNKNAINGMNTVLASPPRNVKVMMARRKCSG
jgi:MFS family permease